MKSKYALIFTMALAFVAMGNVQSVHAKSNVPAKAASTDTADKPASGVAATPSMYDKSGMPNIATKNKCDVCHTLKAKKVGPPWVEVAKMYQEDPEAEAKLIAKIKKGGAGVWGTMPMPPNADVKDADIKALVVFILNLSK